MAKRFYTVKEVNRYIKDLLNGDSLLSSLWVKGEISNFKHHSSGHLYFSLKDDSGSLKCVMFRGKAQGLRFKPVHGMQVLVAGYISLYERDGQYQLYVEEMIPAGAGALHLAYEQLKERLKKEGLFEKSKKKSLPYFPASIGVVTSLSGAALRDILSIAKRRNPQINILIVPAIVQGAEAPVSICSALDKVYQEEVDVIIVGRGGGSLEELWCFNDEQVVRKISESPLPIISAVGHETDFTLSDFAADCRAATPSMAAELVVPVKAELKMQINQIKQRLLTTFSNMLSQEKQRLEYLAKSQVMREPWRLLSNYQQELDNLTSQMISFGETKIKTEKYRLSVLSNKLDALSPLKTMARGYSLCFNDAGEIIKSPNQVEIGSFINVNLNKGQLLCQVKDKKEE